MADSGPIACCCCCCSICLCLFVIISSVSECPINNVCLDYSRIWKTLDEEPIKSGFHYIGFMHKFYEYPTTQLSMDFGYDSGREKIMARSKDGLMVNFKASFQYQLSTKDLHTLYMTYGDDYRTPCARFAVDKMTDEASNFQASEFFKNLNNVQISMLE